jgi:hypothetical protein
VPSWARQGPREGNYGFVWGGFDLMGPNPTAWGDAFERANQHCAAMLPTGNKCKTFQATSKRYEVCNVIYVPRLARLPAFSICSVTVYISEDITEFCA